MMQIKSPVTPGRCCVVPDRRSRFVLLMLRKMITTTTAMMMIMTTWCLLPVIVHGVSSNHQRQHSSSDLDQQSPVDFFSSSFYFNYTTPRIQPGSVRLLLPPPPIPPPHRMSIRQSGSKDVDSMEGIPDAKGGTGTQDGSTDEGNDSTIPLPPPPLPPPLQPPPPAPPRSALPPAPPSASSAADKLVRDVRGFETGTEPASVHRKLLHSQPQFPVTFRTSGAHLITKLKVYATFGIQFKMKTTQPYGLILYSGYGYGKDFMSVELSEGQLRFVFDVGSGPRAVETAGSRPLNDNEWHDVSILRPTVSQHIVRVDDQTTVDNLPDTRSVHYDLLADDLYIGGVTRSMYSSGQLPKQMRSREGFQGCLASIDLNNQCWNVEEHRDDVPKEFKDLIVKGCEGPKNECRQDSCQNDGVCQQHWDSFSCLCDQTSFTGPTCADDSIAYTFGELGGLISFVFAENERPNTKHDQLTMGFTTTQLDALILRVASTSLNDFIEVELIDGAIYVVYNMGNNNHPIGDMDRKVNDGNYHVLRFTRTGQNSSVQIDNHPPISKHPPGRQLMTTFNHQSSVLIGGKKEGNRFVRPFHGVIAGLVLNKLWLLELTAEGDPRVTIEGDVELEISPLRSYYISLGSLLSTTSVVPTLVRPTNKPPSHHVTTSSFNDKHVPKGSQSDSASDLSASGIGSSRCKDDDYRCSQDISKAPRIQQQQQKPSLSPPPQKSTVNGSGRSHSRSSDKSMCTPLGGSAPGSSSVDDDEDCDAQSSGAGNHRHPGGGDRRDGSNPRPETDGRRHLIPGIGHATLSPHPTAPGDVSTPPNSHQRRPSEMSRMTAHQSTTSHSVTSRTGETIQATRQRSSNTVATDVRGVEERAAGVVEGPSGSTGSSGSSAMTSVGLIIGISASVFVLLILLSCAVYKYRTREEGTYSLEAATSEYGYEACHGGNGYNGGRKKLSKADGTAAKTKKRQTKEWYV